MSRVSMPRPSIVVVDEKLAHELALVALQLDHLAEALFGLDDCDADDRDALAGLFLYYYYPVQKCGGIGRHKPNFLMTRKILH